MTKFVRQSRIHRVAAAVSLALPGLALADVVNLGAAANYSLLFQGGGNNTLQVTNVTVDGNVGVAHTGRMTDSGPSTITGSVDFSAANTGQFSNNNGSNVIGGGVHFSQAAVSFAMDVANQLSQTLYGIHGTNLAINGNSTVSASTGAVFNVLGQSMHVFDATAFHNGGNQTLTINGTANDLVAINLDGLGNIQFHGNIQFAGGIGADNVVFNLGGGNYTTFSGGASLDINNNGGAAGTAQGIFLNPNGAISVTNAQIFGRIFGGDSHDLQYVSGCHIDSPEMILIPLPAPALMAGAGLFGVAGLRAARRARPPTTFHRR